MSCSRRAPPPEQDQQSSAYAAADENVEQFDIRLPAAIGTPIASERVEAIWLSTRNREGFRARPRRSADWLGTRSDHQPISPERSPRQGGALSLGRGRRRS